MAHDPSNPFHRLAKTLAGRRKGGQAPSAGGRKEKPRAPAEKRPASGRDDSPADDDGEAALFLDAMSAIRPVKDGGRGAEARHPGREGDSRSRGPRPSEECKRSGPVRPLPPGSLSETAAGFSSLADGPQRPAPPSDPAGPAVPRQGRAASSHESSVPRPGKNTGAAPENEQTGPIRNMRGVLEAMAERDGRQAACGEEELLFARAMRGVAPVAARGREVHAAATGKDRPVPPADPAGALRDLLEGRLEFALHHSDEFMEGHVVGIDPMVMARLRAGQFSPEAHLDLHGQNAVQAQNSLTWFIKNAYQRGLRTVLIVTGRGKNSPDGVGVLRPLLPRWLSRDPFKRVVLAFCTAKSGDGGPGAVYALLRKYKKNRGKIVWEHSPCDDDFPDIV